MTIEVGNVVSTVLVPTYSVWILILENVSRLSQLVRPAQILNLIPMDFAVEILLMAR